MRVKTVSAWALIASLCGLSAAEAGGEGPYIAQYPSSPTSAYCANSDRFTGTLLLDDNNNDFESNMGCSSRLNLEAMVDRPRDLRRGRGARYSDGENAANAITRYRAGATPQPAASEAAPRDAGEK